MRVAVIGLGKLGGPLCLLLREAGLDVMGIDVNPDTLDSLKRGQPTHHEPHLAEMLATHGPKVEWRSDLADAAETDVAFVVVPTNSLPSGAFDVSIVCAVVTAVAQAVPKGHSLALCVVSTVNPGDSEGVIGEALRTAAPEGDVSLVVSPEFVALGSVFADMRRPDLILIGETERWAGDRVLTALRMIHPGHPDDLAPGAAYRGSAPAVHRLSLTDAEIAKLSLNVGLVVKIAYANTVGALVAAHGGNSRQVADAIGADHRIGRAFLSPGPPPAGPCLPRDGVAFCVAAEAVGYEPALLYGARDEATDKRWRIAERIPDDARVVALLGMTYKPGTEVADGAIGPWLVNVLTAATVITHDPLVDSDEMDAQTAINYADTVVLCTDDPAWRDLSYVGKTVVDLWGVPIRTEGVTYVGPS